MWLFTIHVLVLNLLFFDIEALWDAEVTCPIICTCRLEHFQETTIHRFMHKTDNSMTFSEADNHLNNDVFYEDDFDSLKNLLLQSAICILQTETDPGELLGNLPKNTESLTLIQGAGSGNKTITFSQLQTLENLMILELHGTDLPSNEGRTLFCEIDTPLDYIKYLNLDKVMIKVSKKVHRVNHQNHDEVMFEYTQQIKPDSHPLTMVQQNEQKEILPYNKYKEHKADDILLFLGFYNLVLLRVSNCNLNNINWEMFEGLNNLHYLILEKNNLMFIPAFVFYSTPNLRTLSLAWNNLLNIQITDLAGLLELEYLDLSHNNFSQLSELSFPPFPKLKLANFGNNPISVVFPSTFEVMNTTDSLILGGIDIPLTLIANSLLGLKMLKKLTLNNLRVPILKRDLLGGMPNLNELIMSGNIIKIEFDAFLEVIKLEKLIIVACNLQNISIDAFIGLHNMQILDLSQNSLESLSPGTFDPLKNLKELYLSGNKFQELPREIFLEVHPKLIRLTNNPWHCSCRMSNWKPMVVNRIKQKSVKNCDFTHDKGVRCVTVKIYDVKYVFDTRMAPKCATPKKYVNWSVFHVMRNKLKCSNYKPKFRKHVHKNEKGDKVEDIKEKLESKKGQSDAFKLKTEMQSKKYKSKIYSVDEDNDVPIRVSLFSTDNEEDNNLNFLQYPLLNKKSLKNKPTHIKKIKKHKKQNKINLEKF